MGLQDRSYYREDSYSNPWRDMSSSTRSVIVTLIVINLAIFVLDMFTPTLEHSHWLSDFLALKPAEIRQAPWTVWQFLSHGFAHASVNSEYSFFHVAGNMLVLFMLGLPVEKQLGREEFLKFYLAAILISGLGFFVLNFNHPAASVVGASGAVSAVIALFIFYNPNSTLMLFGVVPFKAWILGVVVVGMDLLRSLNPESPIAWQCHLAGFAFGAAYFYWRLNFNWLNLAVLAKPFKRSPGLKIHKPDKTEKLKAEADKVLQKINEHGEGSLTGRERRTLKKYSQQVRKDRD